MLYALYHENITSHKVILSEQIILSTRDILNIAMIVVIVTGMHKGVKAIISCPLKRYILF